MLSKLRESSEKLSVRYTNLNAIVILLEMHLGEGSFDDETSYISLCDTAGFMKTVHSLYTLLMNTIYLSLSTQVAEETVLGNTWYNKKYILILIYLYI